VEKREKGIRCRFTSVKKDSEKTGIRRKSKPKIFFTPQYRNKLKKNHSEIKFVLCVFDREVVQA